MNIRAAREPVLETIMRFSPAALALSALLLTVSSVSIGQRKDSDIAPLSLEWQARGDAARIAGQLDSANDAYESALAADPRNRSAFIALGEVARAQGLAGKAIRFYNEALLLDPADITALNGQALALLDKGALDKARGNLSRIQTVCRGTCPEIASLSSAIQRTASAPPQLSQSKAPPPPAPAAAPAPAPAEPAKP